MKTSDRTIQISRLLVLIAILATLVVTLVPGAMAQGDESLAIKPDSLVYGRSYSEWSAAWEQWTDSIPASNHPLFDTGDCSVGQSGPVWFLGGKFCRTADTSCGFTNIVRTCTVPAGKTLYVAVVNAELSTLEDPSKTQVADLRKAVAETIDATTDVTLTIDGHTVPQLKEAFRVQSPAFPFTMPPDDMFTALGIKHVKPGTYFPGVDDGVYVMVKPLSTGAHTLTLSANFPIWNFSFDVTYHLNVE